MPYYGEFTCRSTVKDYAVRTQRAGLTWPLPETLSDEAGGHFTRNFVGDHANYTPGSSEKGYLSIARYMSPRRSKPFRGRRLLSANAGGDEPNIPVLHCRFIKNRGHRSSRGQIHR